MLRVLRRDFIIAFLAIAGAQTVLAGESWPQFRGPGGQGHADAAAVPLRWSETENVVWKTPLAGRGHSSPVIAGGRIWLTTAIETPLPAGEAKARIAKAPNPVGLAIAGRISLRAVCVDFETGRVLKDVEVFNVKDPEPIHSLNSYASPTPVLEDGLVYCHFGTYGTACLDAASGRVLWTNNSLHVDHQNGPGASPIIWRDLLIAHYDGIDRQFVAALDKRSGRTVWQTARSGEMNPRREMRKAYCTPLVIESGGRTQLISPAADWVYSYDPATGRELWKAHYGQLGFSTVPRPVVGHGMAFICTSFVRSRLLAVRCDGSGDVTKTHVVWHSDRQIPKKPSLLLIGDELYFVSDGGVATCLDARTGGTHWQRRIGGQHSASPLYAGGRIYFFDQDGKITVIRPGTGFEVLARNQLEAGFMASPAVIGDSLILRTTTRLYRIEDTSGSKDTNTR